VLLLPSADWTADQSELIVEMSDEVMFDEVTAAYDRGELTRPQYRALAEAVADSLRAEDQRLKEQEGSS